MNEEIKKILDRAKNLKYKCDCCEEIVPGKYIMKDDKQTDNLIEAVYIIDELLDYITNLQEENEKLKEVRTKLNKTTDYLEGQLDFYKTRNEKAIEEAKEFKKFVAEITDDSGHLKSGIKLRVEPISGWIGDEE